MSRTSSTSSACFTSTTVPAHRPREQPGELDITSAAVAAHLMYEIPVLDRSRSRAPDRICLAEAGASPVRGSTGAPETPSASTGISYRWCAATPADRDVELARLLAVAMRTYLSLKWKQAEEVDEVRLHEAQAAQERSSSSRSASLGSAGDFLADIVG